MSGSAALASARRRRAVPASKMENIVEPPQEQPKMVPTNPTALLLKHNQMLNVLHQDLGLLKTQLVNIKVDPESNNPEHLDFFKSQYRELLEEMKDVKKTLLKVQTFSMETNLELIKLKRLIKIDVEHIPSQVPSSQVPELIIKIEN